MKIHSDLQQCDFLPSFNNLRIHLLLYNFPFFILEPTVFIIFPVFLTYYLK